jgi:hypothetical protein
MVRRWPNGFGWKRSQWGLALPEADQCSRAREQIAPVSGAVSFLEVVCDPLESEDYTDPITNIVPQTIDQLVALALHPIRRRAIETV